MNPNDNLTDNSLPGDAHMTPSDGGAAVDTNTLSLSELNSYLGKDFKDKESALKAVKDTFSFVGKKIEAPASSDSVTKAELQALKEQAFYLENPQYKDYKSIIAKMGGDPSQVVGSDEFKSIFEKVKLADEVSKSRTVLQSSPRLAQQKTKIDEAVQIANARNQSTLDVANVLAGAILEDAAN